MTLTDLLFDRLAPADSDQEPPEDVQQLNTLPAAFADGNWTVDDIEWIVRWKSTRSMGYFEQNDHDKIEACVTAAINANRPAQKLDSLTNLDGVAIRVASAILMFMEPDRFTVLDWRTWQTLKQAGYLRDEFPNHPGVDAYLIYLGACWAIANEYAVSLRTLDRVLWSLGDT